MLAVHYFVCAVRTRLKTFSLDYAGNDRYFTPEKFQPTSDTAFIQIMQKALNTDGHWTVLTPEDLTDALEQATMARDLPGMADVDFSLLIFCREIKKEVTVALSGECADEIFGGYPWYRDSQVRQVDGFPWAQNTAQRAQLLSADLATKLDPQTFVADRYRQTVFETDILPGVSPQERRMKEMVNLNYRWFVSTDGGNTFTEIAMVTGASRCFTRIIPRRMCSTRRLTRPASRRPACTFPTCWK